MKNKKVFILAGLVVLAVAVGGFMMFGQPAPAPADSGLLVQSGSAGEGGPEESGATESTPGSEDLDYLAATEAEPPVKTEEMPDGTTKKIFSDGSFLTVKDGISTPHPAPASEGSTGATKQNYLAATQAEEPTKVETLPDGTFRKSYSDGSVRVEGPDGVMTTGPINLGPKVGQTPGTTGLLAMNTANMRDPFMPPRGAIKIDTPPPAPRPTPAPARRPDPLPGNIAPMPAPLPGGANGLSGGIGSEGATAVPQEPRYKVRGIVIGNRSVAVFEDENGNQRLIPEGGSVDGQTRVKRIERGRVTVETQGKEKTLTIEEEARND